MDDHEHEETDPTAWHLGSGRETRSTPTKKDGLSLVFLLLFWGLVPAVPHGTIAVRYGKASLSAEWPVPLDGGRAQALRGDGREEGEAMGPCGSVCRAQSSYRETVGFLLQKKRGQRTPLN